MNVLSIKVNETTYKAGKISMYLTKEVLKIQKEALSITKIDEESISDTEKAEEILDRLFELGERKTLLLCEVYGDMFTPEELERAMSQQEIDFEINKVIRGASRVIEKN